MKNFLLALCVLIPTMSFSQVVFNSNGNSDSFEKDDFPDELYRANTSFVLENNTIKAGEFIYRISKVLKEKSYWNNSIIVEVTLISPIVTRNQQEDDGLIMGDNSMGEKYRKGMPVHLDNGPINPLSEVETFEVGYDISDKIKYIITAATKNYMGQYRKKYTKYVIGSNFKKTSETPSVKW